MRRIGFTKGSRDANDTITDMEQWCCETCGGFARHIHPRPVEAKRQRVTWTQSLAPPVDTSASTGGFGGEGLSAPSIDIESGKGKEPMSVQNADRRLDTVHRMTEERPIANTNPISSTVLHRGMGTGISEAIKRVPIFSFANKGGKQVSFHF